MFYVLFAVTLTFTDPVPMEVYSSWEACNDAKKEVAEQLWEAEVDTVILYCDPA